MQYFKSSSRKSVLTCPRVLALALLCLVLAWLFPPSVQAAPLPAQAAFVLSATPLDPNALRLQWTLPPGYFLYQQRLHLTLTHGQAHAKQGLLQLPPASQHIDRQHHAHAVYRHQLQLSVPILGQTPGTAELSVRYQGCSDEGFCYPMQTQHILLTIGPDRALTAVQSTHAQRKTSPDPIHALFEARPPLFTLISFFGFGLLLALTPCILPILPILSSILLRNQPHRAFSLSCAYVLGISLSYALIGGSFALMGHSLQPLLQSPLMIIAVACLLIIFACNLWDLIEFRFPTSSRLTHYFQTHNATSFFSATCMGALSTLILSPCVTPPLIGALTYIAETGRVMLGISALFCLGLGFGAPLLLLSTPASRYLPKAGLWMQGIKRVLGLILLLLALYLLSPLLSFTPLASNTVRTLPDLMQRLQTHAHHPVLLDFYATWCADCRFMEATLFHEPKVREALKTITVIKVDVTHPKPATPLLDHFHVIGPPTFIFLDDQGEEITALRLTGLVSASTLLSHLQQATHHAPPTYPGLSAVSSKLSLDTADKPR